MKNITGQMISVCELSMPTTTKTNAAAGYPNMAVAG